MTGQEARDDERETLASQILDGMRTFEGTNLYVARMIALTLHAAGYRKHPEPEMEYLGGPNVTYRRTKAVPAGPWLPVGEGETDGTR